jgi:hypothetical protein
MKIISLLKFTLAVALAGIWAPLAVAQSSEPVEAQDVLDLDALDQDVMVTVSFGAVMMQVPVRLALQLCPGTETRELARSATVAEGVACVIPQESYASQPAADEAPSQ